MSKFDERGREIPDQTPVEVPLSARRPESMQDIIARMVRAQVNEVADQNGYPSFEEEDDFDDPTESLDEEMLTQYTVQDMTPIGSENDLDGSQGLELSNEDDGKGSAGKAVDGAQEGLDEAPGAEAPQE